jgi:hypothetical protein
MGFEGEYASYEPVSELLRMLHVIIAGKKIYQQHCQSNLHD